MTAATRGKGGGRHDKISAALAGATRGFVAADRTNRINLSAEEKKSRPDRVKYANGPGYVVNPDNALSFGRF
ncbi:hypothetical protein AB0M02_10105 [Actinoplanes sp. NPDC051861]|uniref:hypothetical protein n=1 Tax=Actinoplanes sp. NPDC051861 TaxID=3155170 RepID=UPI00341FD061